MCGRSFVRHRGRFESWRHHGHRGGHEFLGFAAVGLLVSGVTGLAERRPVHASEEARERELLEAIRGSGEISAAAAAVETSMTVAEVDRRLRELAEGGHLELRVRGGAIFYALWEAEGRRIEGVR